MVFDQLHLFIVAAMWYVYVLEGQGGKLYIGSTNDLSRRINEHIDKKCRTTKQILPIKLKTYIAVESRIQARRLEKYLKSGSGNVILKKRILSS